MVEQKKQKLEDVAMQDKKNNYFKILKKENINVKIFEPFSQISIDKWYHILIGRINGVATMYVNGIVEDTVTATGSVTTTDPLYIGSDTGSEDFIGLIKDVAVWSHGLSDSAVIAIYNKHTKSSEIIKTSKGS